VLGRAPDPKKNYERGPDPSGLTNASPVDVLSWGYVLCGLLSWGLMSIPRPQA